MSGSLAMVFAGGRITEDHPSRAFVSINSGSHKIATDAGNAIFRLFGRSGATTSQVIDTSELTSSSSTLDLGTDEPLRRSGSGAFLEVSNASVTTSNAGAGGALLLIDDALLNATAPILNLKSGGSLTTAAEGINLTAKSKLVATGPLLKIDGGTLTIGNGSAVNAGGGSFLSVTGDLISMIGGTLNVSNGALLKSAGSSVVRIGGGLVNFNNSGATINLTNNLCAPSGCTIINGVKFFFTNGGTSANVSVSGSPFKNAAVSTTVNLSNGGNTAHVIVDGAGSKVIISGN
jgi:hypothetical protein